MIEPLPAILIHTTLVLPHEGIHTNDGKDQPEDETDQQHVEDTGQRTDQSVDHNLHALHLCHGTKRSERSQSSHSFEDRDVSCSEEGGGEVYDGDCNDDKVEPTPGVAEVRHTTHSQHLSKHSGS